MCRCQCTSVCCARNVCVAAPTTDIYSIHYHFSNNITSLFHKCLCLHATHSLRVRLAAKIVGAMSFLVFGSLAEPHLKIVYRQNTAWELNYMQIPIFSFFRWHTYSFLQWVFVLQKKIVNPFNAFCEILVAFSHGNFAVSSFFSLHSHVLFAI